LCFQSNIGSFFGTDIYRFVGEIAGFTARNATTISGIVGVIKISLKITTDIVDKFN